MANQPPKTYRRWAGVSLAAACVLIVGQSTGAAQSPDPVPEIEPAAVELFGGPADQQDVLRPPAGLDSAVAIAASDTPGSYSNLALRSDGTVVGWGLNRFGEATPPKGLRDVQAIDIGAGFSVALTGAGSVVAWGSDDSGQTDVPTDLGEVTAIAAGGYWGYRGFGVPEAACGFGLALRADGTVVRWGQGAGGSGCDQLAALDPPADLQDVVGIAAGARQALALKADGSVVAWGPGVGTGLDGTHPSQWSDVVAVSAGSSHSLGLRSDGTVLAYGIWGESGPPSVSEVAALSASGRDVFLHRDSTISVYPETWPPSAPTGDGYQAVAAGSDYGLAISAPVEPEPSASPDPTVPPEPTESPEPTGAPEPTGEPEPTLSPKPTSAPKPTAPPRPAPVRKPAVRVSARPVSHARKLAVDVDPDKGRGFWTFTVQKRTKGAWSSIGSYRTHGQRETRVINLPKGSYRVVVSAKYGYRAAASTVVTLKR